MSIILFATNVQLDMSEKFCIYFSKIKLHVYYKLQNFNLFWKIWNYYEFLKKKMKNETQNILYGQFVD